MEAIQPAHSTAVLLLIAAAAVALLLFLIIGLKLHAFVSLVAVSVVTALAAGIPVGDVPDALLYGFADTIGSVALLVGFGVMIGRLLEISGGAQVLADTLISRFGESRAPLALGVASLIFGLPIFFDAGLVVFLPIILTVARRFGGSLLLYALPSAGAFAAMHALVPPHPGPVAAATQIGADVGLTLLVGIVVGVLAWYVGVYLFSRAVGQRVHVDIPEILFGEVNGGQARPVGSGVETGGTSAGSGAGSGGGTAGGTGTAQTADAPAQPGGTTTALAQRAPTFGTVLGLLLLPLVLISLDTILGTLVDTGVLADDQTWVNLLRLLGNTTVALLITTLAAIFLLRPRHQPLKEISSVIDRALGPVCAIILITGAGGMFGGVLELSGIGQALSGSLKDLGISLIVQAFVIAALLRVAQGSATVALTTTAGLIAGPVAAAGLGSFDLTLLVVAIAAGATVLSHVNDSGFWLVSRFFGMDEKTTLKTWTVMETTLGVSAFVIAAICWAVF